MIADNKLEGKRKMITATELIEAGFAQDESEQISGLVNGTISPSIYESVRKWIGQCFNEPEHSEQIMVAINEIMGGFGVEPIRGDYVDSFYQDIQAEYINMGDTYDITILRDSQTGDYEITSFGDWVEQFGEERGIV